MAGRKRKPTLLKVIKGTAQPCRMNPDEPEPVGGIGDPPAEFSEEQLGCWHELSSMSHPGVLSQADGVILEVCAALLAEMRANYIAFPAAKLGKLMAGLAQLGMTPADRSKVSAPKGAGGGDGFNRFRD